MASTYSTDLRLELIGSGDQAGTWGTTTNTNLGTLLEQAIAGVSGGPYISGTYPVVNFPTDADITLTANNGSVDQSRSAVLVVTSTGSLTATRNVIAPASASKTYTIKNSTTGGQSIQVKYATGTGVTIPNGTTTSIYGDGTNFYSALSGTLPVSITGSSASATTATTATNVASGATGSLPYQTGASTTSMLALGTTNYVLTAGASAPQYVAQSTLSVGFATTATNATNATNSTNITNSGGWSVTPSGAKLYFNYNGTNVGSLDSSGNFIVTGNVTAYGTP